MWLGARGTPNSNKWSFTVAFFAIRGKWIICHIASTCTLQNQNNPVTNTDFTHKLAYNICVTCTYTQHSTLACLPMMYLGRDSMFFFLQDINECASDPCQNGGTCMDAQNGYTCMCSQGFEGLHCEGGEVLAYTGIWNYDTDVHIMWVLYLAVMHERGQHECITAKYSTSMMSSVSYDPSFLFISRFSH